MSKVPKLRFKEFRGDWRIDALEPHVDILSGVPLKSDEISEDEKGVPILRGINITEGFIRHSKDIDRYYLSSTKQVEKFLVAKGDLVIGMDGSKVGKNVALVSESDSGAILIQRVARIRSRHTSDIRFIYHHIFSPKFHRYVDEVNTSSGIPHISLKQINEFKIGFPSLPEQQKIASFLSAVDEKIQQLTRKKELLADYKKGVMQQLFSGKLRFKDPKGNPYPKWEEKKLGDISTINTGASNRQDSGLDGEFVFFDRSEDIRTSSRYLFDGEAVIVPGEGQDFIPKYFVGKFDLHQRTYAVMNFKDLSGKYLFYFIYQSQKHFLAHAVGSTVKSLRMPIFEKLVVKVPCDEEQQKIASYLSALDAKIESAAAQVSKVQEFKKGLLQQMFV